MTVQTTQPPNPFKEARESIIDPVTKRSISHHQLARKMGVTKLSLIRLEQGMFTEPLPTVLKYLINHGFNELALTDGYYNFQHHMRVANAYYFGPHLEFDITSVIHPMGQLRHNRGVNPTECAKALCLPQSTLVYFETKYRRQQSVPKCVINVLPVLGYSDDQISSFLKDYKDWRNRALGKNVVDFGERS